MINNPGKRIYSDRVKMFQMTYRSTMVCHAGIRLEFSCYTIAARFLFILQNQPWKETEIEKYKSRPS